MPASSQDRLYNRRPDTRPSNCTPYRSVLSGITTSADTEMTSGTSGATVHNARTPGLSLAQEDREVRAPKAVPVYTRITALSV